MMLSMRSMTIMLFSVALLFTAGCGGGDPATEAAVRARLATFAEALRAGDREAFIDCYDVTGEVDRELVGATFEVARAMMKLHDAVANAHGEAEVRLFAAGVNRSGPALPTDDQWPAEALLSIDRGAGEATASVPGNDRPMRLVLREGRWLIAVAMPGEGAAARQWVEQRAELMRRIAAAADAVRTELAEAGASPEEVRAALARRIAALIRPTLEADAAAGR